MKPHDAYAAKRELRTLGVVSILVAVVLALLVLLLAVRQTIEPFFLLLVLLALVAGLQVLAAVVVFRCRKHIKLALEETTDHAACSECKGVFNVHDMIALSGIYVCARCKPVFLQKLAEGTVVAPEKKTGPHIVVKVLIIVGIVAFLASIGPCHGQSTGM